MLITCQWKMAKMLQLYQSKMCITAIDGHICMLIGRVGASPPSHTTGLNLYIRSMCPIRIAHVRATGKHKAGSLQVQRSHILKLSKRLFSFHNRPSLCLDGVNAS